MIGLVFIALPFCYFAVGGFQEIRQTLPAKYFDISNISWQQSLNWFITIVPILFIGMTLYQRIYAAGNVKTDRKAWFIAGLFEYPVMAFTGVILGLFAKVAFENGIIPVADFHIRGAVDPELGLPLLLRTILPVGLTGIILSAYFSAVMSTADSCLMAASGNIVTDIFRISSTRKVLHWSQATTLLLGISALFISLWIPNVLDLMLYSYAFMVSGLFVPVLAAVFQKKPNAVAALPAMIAGGLTTLILSVSEIKLPWGLDPNVFGISISFIVYISVSFFQGKK